LSTRGRLPFRREFIAARLPTFAALFLALFSVFAALHALCGFDAALPSAFANVFSSAIRKGGTCKRKREHGSESS
jgi:hypothetical protein